MMKWLIGTLAMTGFLCALGCSSGDISSEGKVLHVVGCRPWQTENRQDQAIQKLEDAIPDIPSKAPTMERFEWGRVIDDHDSISRSHRSHYLLVLFKDPQSAFDRVYQQALDEAAGRLDEAGPFFVMGDSETYLLHDATPHVQTTTHGHLRRMVRIRFKSNVTPEEMQKFEHAVAVLPNNIPNIERFEWGTRTGYDPTKPKPVDSAYRNGEYILLFTFESTVARDTYLAHPAYKEFQSVLKQYEAAQWDCEFVSQVEYIARPG